MSGPWAIAFAVQWLLVLMLLLLVAGILRQLSLLQQGGECRRSCRLHIQEWSADR